MNQARGPLSSASHFLSIFDGGRSPGHWRREMSRLIEPLSAIQVNSNWVRELASLDLKLSDSPLFGETLVELTSRNTVNNASPAESKATRRVFSESAGTGKRELKMNRDLHSDNSSSRVEGMVPQVKRAALRPVMSSAPDEVEAVLQLPRQVDASFLRRLVGDPSEVARHGSGAASETKSGVVKRHSAQASKVAERSKQQRELRTLTSTRKSSSRSAVVQPRAPVARMDQVAYAPGVQRVARRIEAAFQRRSLLTHEFSASAVTRGKVSLIHWQSLADQWSMPMDGPTASADILMRLAEFASLADRGSRTDMKPAWSDSSQGEPSAVVVDASPKHQRQTGAAPTVSESRNSDLLQQPMHWNTHVRQPWSSQVDDLAGNIASEIFSESPLPEKSDVARWTGLVPTSTQAAPLLMPAVAPAIAPPSVTPSLPPMHSHKQHDVVLPIAAATAQRQSRVEEEIAHGEDLGLLADRMARILKQEARRHGIDV
jgi:hypothetical protein